MNETLYEFIQRTLVWPEWREAKYHEDRLTFTERLRPLPDAEPDPDAITEAELPKAREQLAELLTETRAFESRRLRTSAAHLDDCRRKGKNRRHNTDC